MELVQMSSARRRADAFWSNRTSTSRTPLSVLNSGGNTCEWLNDFGSPSEDETSWPRSRYHHFSPMIEPNASLSSFGEAPYKSVTVKIIAAFKRRAIRVLIPHRSVSL